MSFLWSAIDESNDRDQKHAFVTAGWLSQQPIWTDVERYWQQRLDKDSIGYFKSSECKSLSKQFRKFRDKEAYPNGSGRKKADDIFDDLAQILRSSNLVGFVLVIDLKDHRDSRMSSRTRAILPSDPYLFAYQLLLVRIACQVAQFKKPQPVAFLCDHHDKFKQLDASYEQLKKKNPDCGRFMGSLNKMEDQKSPAIQTADLLASVCQRSYVRLMKGKVDKPGFASEVKAQVGKYVGVGMVDRHIIKLATEANLLKRGRPNSWSSSQFGLFTKAWE